MTDIKNIRRLIEEKKVTITHSPHKEGVVRFVEGYNRGLDVAIEEIDFLIELEGEDFVHIDKKDLETNGSNENNTHKNNKV